MGCLTEGHPETTPGHQAQVSLCELAACNLSLGTLRCARTTAPRLPHSPHPPAPRSHTQTHRAEAEAPKHFHMYCVGQIESDCLWLSLVLKGVCGGGN